MTRASILAMLALAGIACADAQRISKLNGSIIIPAGQHSGSVSTVNGSIEVGFSRTPGNLSTRNGSIEVGSDQTVGNVGTVNGSIHITDKDVVGHAHTVNGRIDLGGSMKALSVQTFNGAVSIGPQARISGTVTTVNGSIALEQGAEVSGHVASVNGRISLHAARVENGIQSASGDIDIGARSRVDGGILIKSSKGSRGWWPASCQSHTWKWVRAGACRTPRVAIGPDSIVTGTLKFEHSVKLYVSDTARVGQVQGATAIRYSGERPPA